MVIYVKSHNKCSVFKNIIAHIFLFNKGFSNIFSDFFVKKFAKAIVMVTENIYNIVCMFIFDINSNHID